MSASPAGYAIGSGMDGHPISRSLLLYKVTGTSPCGIVLSTEVQSLRLGRDFVYFQKCFGSEKYTCHVQALDDMPKHQIFLETLRLKAVDEEESGA